MLAKQSSNVKKLVRRLRWLLELVTCMQLMQSGGADDELDEAAMFEKIVAGDCDTNDPVWLGISQDAQQLVVSLTPEAAHTCMPGWPCIHTFCLSLLQLTVLLHLQA